MSLKHKTKYSEDHIKTCIPSTILKQKIDLRLFFIVNDFNKLEKQHHTAFKHKINSLLNPYFELFDYNNLKIKIFDYHEVKKIDKFWFVK